MLLQLIAAHPSEIVARTHHSLAEYYPETPPTLENLPSLLDGIAQRLETRRDPHDKTMTRSIRAYAADQARALHRAGFSIDAACRAFGAVCDAITGLAADEGRLLDARDMQLLNLCLDESIACAVTEYVALSEHASQARAAERIGFLAHEMRNALSSATIAFDALRSGVVAVNGRTGATLQRSLHRIEQLLGHALAAARLQAGAGPKIARVPVVEVVREIEATFRPPRGITFGVQIDGRIEVECDRDLLFSAISNLVQNAFKFTRSNEHVELRVSATDHLLVVQVEDRCGGLTVDRAQLFSAFQCATREHSGAGLGLAITREACEAHHGTIDVEDMPGVGCVFTLRWPLTQIDA